MPKNSIMKLKNGEIVLVSEDQNFKILKNDQYNYIFRKEDGLHMRWGSTPEEDGNLNLALPEIVDIECSTLCAAGCKFCYKSNLPKGKNMSLDTYRKILQKLPPSVYSIALGIGDIKSHPELFDIIKCTKDEFGIIPNITINDHIMDEDIAAKLVEHIGGIAVSHYNFERLCNTVEILHNAGAKQIKIHNTLAKETLNHTWNLIKKFKQEPRLQCIQAIVLLSLKKKGRAVQGSGFNIISVEEFRDIWQYILKEEIPLGFDSCSAQKLIKAMSEEEKEKYMSFVEPCEATLYSLYINVDGKLSPCSFIDKTEEWTDGGLDILQSDKFLKDIWYNSRIEKFRKDVFTCKKQCKACPVYEI